ncbi:MAG: response regulator [Clostridium sp.]|nr:response regulator [Clostridium sp.]MCM1399048.1 response regulator [Clostridium sp.]MCM1459440.1 response regulator [Bacteroides sp.]
MRKSILIVDDDELNRELLKQIFEDKYEILMAQDGKEAIEQLDEHMNDIAVILLDLIMPVFNGFQVLKLLNTRKILVEIPVVLVTTKNDEQTEFECYSLGASAVITKPFVAQTVKQRVNNIIELHRNADMLERKIEQQRERIDEQRRKMEIFNEKLVDVVSNIVEFRDLESGAHVKRVKGLTGIMAETYMKLYPESGLTKEKINVIVRASALHDIGKISIPDSILLKPGRLTDEEREVMMTHTTKGCEILKLIDVVQDDEQMKAAYEICRHHHERYDGRGYPDKLKGDDIPLSAQLVSIVDVYDALVCERVYKKAFDKETAYNMIQNGECGIFSPKLLTCFEHARRDMEKFSDTQKD